MGETPVNVTAKAFIAGSMALFLAACGDSAKLPEEAAFGPNPTLPEPTETIIPTINIAPAKGWPEGASPAPSAGLSVQAFAVGLDHPRWLYVLPNGDVLVAETNAPLRPENERGVKGWIFRIEQDRAAAGRSERQPYHLVARRRWRRCRGDANGFSSGVEFTVRHGARGP